VTFRGSLALSALLIFSAMNSLSASEITDGFVRLILHERTGRFSLYYLADPEEARYEPLFNSRNPGASFLSVFVDGNAYRLGDSWSFRTRFEMRNRNPAFVFESAFLTVSEVFSPVRSASSKFANGIMITITIENKSSRRLSVGMRFLLDTELGEGQGKVPFVTNSQSVSKETLIESSSGELYWLSGNENVSLMGSIINPLNYDAITPNFVHIANWRRLNEVPWTLRYSEGRSFNFIPYSIGDSAVCYYYEPAPLESGNSFTYTIVLTTEDVAWYNSIPDSFRPARQPQQQQENVSITALEWPDEVQTQGQTQTQTVIETPRAALTTIDVAAIEKEASMEAAANNGNSDMLTLIKLQEILDQFIAGEIYLNEHDLTEIEMAIERLRNRN
jgi:hypothetical protein